LATQLHREFVSLRSRFCLGLMALSGTPMAGLGEEVTLRVRREFTDAGPAEMIVVPWSEVKQRLPSARIFHLTLSNVETGASVPLQVTNFEHDHKGFAADELVFQYDFAAGEKEALFRLETTEKIMPPEGARVFARFVPERHDDFAWENDRIAYRMYGPSLDSPAAGRERLRSSGIDIWVKRARYLVIDRWYLKGHDGFHQDDGEGLDPHSIGPSRGAGGTGVWDGQRLRTSGNFTTWKVLANGPLRAVFELGFAPWDAGDGLFISETKRFTVDAGSNLHAVESTFAFVGGPELTVAIGIIQSPNARGTLRRDGRAGTMTYWFATKAGHVGIAAVLGPETVRAGMADEPLGSAGAHGNALLLAKVRSGVPLRYALGAAWEGSGDFRDEAAWGKYVAAAARRSRAPAKVDFE